MRTLSPPAAATGFHGKSPAYGDFVTRQMPAGFLPVWHAFLQDMVQTSRESLGETWLPAWLSMPVWHFGLGPGIAAPGGARGVLIPSLDRVGRHFPFSMIAPCAAGGIEWKPWALAAEALALGALDDDFDAAELQGGLAELGLPVERETAGLRQRFTPLADEPGDWPPALGSAADPAPGETLWWCRGGERIPAGLWRVSGLPPPAELVAGGLG